MTTDPIKAAIETIKITCAEIANERPPVNKLDHTLAAICEQISNLADAVKLVVDNQQPGIETLNPGDTLILTVPNDQTYEETQHLQQQWAKVASNVPVIFLQENLNPIVSRGQSAERRQEED